MRIALLSRSRKAPSTARFIRAAKARGHKVTLVSPRKAHLLVNSTGCSVIISGKPLGPVDLVLARLPRSGVGLHLLEAVESGAGATMTSSFALERALSPVRALHALAAAGVAVPASVTANDGENISELLQHVGGFPVRVRVAGGGKRPLIAESENTLQAALQALTGLGLGLFLQHAAVGKPRRVLVVGGKALGQSSTVGKLAVRAAAALGLELAAVDIQGGQVFDVNPTPRLTFAAATQLVARAEQLHAAATPRRKAS